MVSWRKPSTSAACSRTLLLSWEIIVFCPARARLSVDNFTGHWCPPSLSDSGELPFHYQRYLASSNTHREHTHFKVQEWLVLIQPRPQHIFKFVCHHFTFQAQCAHTCSTMPYTCLVSALDCPTTTQDEHGTTVFALMTTTVGINWKHQQMLYCV